MKSNENAATDRKDSFKPAVKASKAHTCSGAVWKQNSVSLSSFFYGSQKGREFSNITEDDLGLLALCHLSDRAAT